MSLLRMTLLAAILVALPAASALGAHFGPASVTVTPAAPPEPPLPPLEPPATPPSPDEVQDEVDRAEGQARATVAHLETELRLVVAQKVSEAETALEPGHQIVADAEHQVQHLLEDPAEPEPEPEPEVRPQTEASVVQAWPQYTQPVMILTGAAAGLGALMWLLGQTATAGAGAATTAAARDGRRFLPFASPMFTRFERDTVLGHPKREAIYGQIIGRPGITLQDLCGESGLSRTAVTHHLRLLEQQHLIVSKRVGRSRHFFENGGRFGRHQKDAYAVLHNERSKEIHDFISHHPGTIQKDLCGAFGIQASVAHWHVKRLLEANLVEAVRRGRTVSYFPAGQAPEPAYAWAGAPAASYA